MNSSRFAHPHQPIPEQQLFRSIPTVEAYPLQGFAGVCRVFAGVFAGDCRGGAGTPGRSGGLLGPSWERSSKTGESTYQGLPVGARKVASWGPLGRSWARLGPLLGPSWDSLGPSWGLLEASRAHPKRKGGKAKNIDFLWVLVRFWPLGDVLRRLRDHLEPSLGGLGAYCRRVGRYLESSRAILCDIGGHLELSWALLAPSWAILGHLRVDGFGDANIA